MEIEENYLIYEVYIRSRVSGCECVFNNKLLCIFGLIICVYYIFVLESGGCYLFELWFFLLK